MYNISKYIRMHACRYVCTDVDMINISTFIHFMRLYMRRYMDMDGW